MIVYKTSDLIEVTIGKRTVLISPLTGSQYANVIGLTRMEGGQAVPDPAGMALLTLRYAVKGLKGADDITFADGTKVNLELDGSGILTDDSVSLLLQIFQGTKLTEIAARIASGNIRDIKLDGVKVKYPDGGQTKKNRK